MFEEHVEIPLDNGASTTLYKHEGATYICLSSDGGSVFIEKLSDEQINTIKRVLS